ncbi:DNA cytosine methyltransferase [Erysipelothrix rhusiopathiae]|nr:DNA cytosine methyltransferase [Erysipelothrix rhusiopathiae]MDE8117658.1 DNA cytosine methyltransferase [Erysipelothrix rhusiopathiae]MDE8201987.1 DNA cytosine methyltransferase [Erysipelothrix rhusiopathiae]MDE8227838.1 DNA cytosine methyltransferase [Erysipelothrix rhusiopathiae]MDE8252883.1 DNA cytosine methyltransferase [Erysipelothrix rhusiopathiae]
MKKGLKFIDLFAGIGGFHQAMLKFDGECVFASEIDQQAIATYMENYGINADYDICEIDEKEIPKHDVLCGGFPCQTFSKAGKQAGMKDARGTLFFEILRILKHHKTKFVILENVRNLVTHDGGNTWKVIRDSLHELGYRLTDEPLILSPYQFGIPQSRDRVYILGIYDPENKHIPLDIKFDNLLNKSDNSIYSILDDTEVNIPLSEYERDVLEIWEEFYHGIEETVIGFPVWIDYFQCSDSEIKKYPVWKQKFIISNKKLYQNNKKFIDGWLDRNNDLEKFIPTHRKFEWQAGEEINSIYDGVIQFRPSGVRVKKPDVFPALVAMVQIPILGKSQRKLTVRECARLQSFPDNFIPNCSVTAAYKQLGNSVNVKVVEKLVEKLLNYTD